MTPVTLFCTVDSLPLSCKPVLVKAIGTVHFDLISSSVFTCNVFTHGVTFAQSGEHSEEEKRLEEPKGERRKNDRKRQKLELKENEGEELSRKE